MGLELLFVKNGNTPREEYVVLEATETVNLKGYAVVDRTFDANGKVSNEFRHIYIFPDVQIPKGTTIFLDSCTGTNGFREYSDSKTKYYQCYWGSDSCIWNDKGGDTASLIRYVLVESVSVPPVK